MIPVYITCRDRVTPLKKLVSWLEKADEAKIVILDNDSAYPPMNEYLDSCKHDVYRQGHNHFGHLVAWKSKIMETYPSEYFMVTDEDYLPIDECPLDALTYLAEAHKKYGYSTVGLGVEIKNLPDHYKRKQEVIGWEGRFWEKPIGDFFEARIDTSPAIYERGGYNDPDRVALRANYPYVCTHDTWYTDSNNPSEEELFYVDRASSQFAHWGRGHIEGHL